MAGRDDRRQRSAPVAFAAGLRYHDGEYEARNPGWHAEDAPFKARHVLAMLERHHLEPRTVGEIGCGAGELLRRLSEALPGTTRLTGFDVSPQAIALCPHGTWERLRFELGEGWRDGDGVGYDLILLIDVIEHVEDYFALLRAAAARARHVILHIPLDLSAQSVLRGRPLLREREDVGHVHYFTKDTALAALEETDLEVLDWRYTSATTELPARSWLSAAARWPRKLAFRLAGDFAVRLLGGYSVIVLTRSRLHAQAAGSQ